MLPLMNNEEPMLQHFTHAVLGVELLCLILLQSIDILAMVFRLDDSLAGRQPSISTTLFWD